MNRTVKWWLYYAYALTIMWALLALLYWDALWFAKLGEWSQPERFGLIIFMVFAAISATMMRAVREDRVL